VRVDPAPISSQSSSTPPIRPVGFSKFFPPLISSHFHSYSFHGESPPRRDKALPYVMRRYSYYQKLELPSYRGVTLEDPPLKFSLGSSFADLSPPTEARFFGRRFPLMPASSPPPQYGIFPTVESLHHIFLPRRPDDGSFDSLRINLRENLTASWFLAELCRRVGFSPFTRIFQEDILSRTPPTYPLF